jgi:hypothetical protein
MKRIIAVSLIAASLVGCGQPAWIGGKKYDTYGLFNESTHKNPNIAYEVSIGNVVWSIILVETIVFPVYFVGFSLFNPVGPKGDASQNGVVR